MTQNQIAYHNALELKRHNIASENELNRHQLMQEALTRWSNAIQKWSIAVNNLHYARMDAENERSNRANEALKLANLNESIRTNVANESIRREQNRINSTAAAVQSAVQKETSRHNQVMESIQQSLNESTINKQEAETSYTTENTKYIQERTNTQRAETSKTWAQEGNFRADTYLKYQMADTESTKQFANVMGGVKSGSDAITGLIKVIPVRSSGGSNLVEIVNSIK